MPIKAIIQRYFPNSEIIKLSRPKGGISADMHIAELNIEGKEQAIVIRQIQSAEDEFNLLTALQETPIPAPIPLFLDTTCSLAPQPFMILKHVTGEPLYSSDDPADIGEQIGTQLAAIHSVQTSPLNFPLIRSQKIDLPTDSGFAGARPIIDMLKPIWPLKEFNHPVLLHGDFWPGNMLWQNNKLTGIIDWEDAKLGNPLQDLAISRFDVLFIFGQSAFEALTQVYQLKRHDIDYVQLPYWDLFVAVRAIKAVAEWAAGWPDLGRPDLTEESIWQSLNWFIQQAMAKINSGNN